MLLKVQNHLKVHFNNVFLGAKFKSYPRDESALHCTLHSELALNCLCFNGTNLLATNSILKMCILVNYQKTLLRRTYSVVDVWALAALYCPCHSVKPLFMQMGFVLHMYIMQNFKYADYCKVSESFVGIVITLLVCIYSLLSLESH